MAQRLRPLAANRAVALLLGHDRAFALGLDVGELEFLAEDFRQLVHRQIDFKDVLAGRVAGLAGAIAFFRLPADRIAGLAIAAADAALVLAEAEVRQLDLRK